MQNDHDDDIPILELSDEDHASKSVDMPLDNLPILSVDDEVDELLRPQNLGKPTSQPTQRKRRPIANASPMRDVSEPRAKQVKRKGVTWIQLAAGGGLALVLLFGFWFNDGRHRSLTAIETPVRPIALYLLARELRLS